MINKGIIIEILNYSLSTGASYVELFFEEASSNYYSMLNNKIGDGCSEYRNGLGIKITINNKDLYATCNSFNKKNIFSCISRLISHANSGQKIFISDLGKKKYSSFKKKNYKKNFNNKASKKNCMLRASRAAFAFSNNIENVMVNYFDGIRKTWIINSEGINVFTQQNRTRLAVTAIARNNQRKESGIFAQGKLGGLESYDETAPEKIGYEAARIASSLLNATPCPSGHMPVILSHGLGGVLIHEACGHALESPSVVNKSSIFADELGKKVANDKLTVIDDPTLPFLWGSYDFDDEGYDSFSTTLIENGILKNYLYDHKSANILKSNKHHNSRRESYHFKCSARMSNTYVLNGSDSFSDMISEIQFGLYAKSFGGGSVDNNGNFNFSVKEAYLIENGKITVPVRGATLIGNSFDILNCIDRISNDLEFGQAMCYAISGTIPVCVGQPSLRIKKILVGGIGNVE